MRTAEEQRESDDDEFENEHIVHFPEPCEFELSDDFDYLREGALQSSAYRFSRPLLHIPVAAFLRLTFGLELRGTPDGIYNGGKGAIVVCNHVNMLDCLMLDCLFPFRRMYYTTLETNFKIPVARKLMRYFGGIPIPKSVHKLRRFSDELSRAVEGGAYVCFYPEGVLIPYYNGGLRKFHAGAFRIAAETGCPIIPVVIDYRKPDGLFALYKKKPCATLTVLPEITPNGDSDIHAETDSLMKRCRESMEKAVKTQ